MIESCHGILLPNAVYVVGCGTLEYCTTYARNEHLSFLYATHGTQVGSKLLSPSKTEE